MPQLAAGIMRISVLPNGGLGSGGPPKVSREVLAVGTSWVGGAPERAGRVRAVTPTVPLVALGLDHCRPPWWDGQEGRVSGRQS